MDFIFFYAILIFSVVLHELGHGYAALALGDSTARRMGRLTINPLCHVDLFYTLIMPITLYALGLPPLAVAKPVPVNPQMFHSASPRRGMMLVAAAGPLVNFAILLFSTLCLHLGLSIMPPTMIELSFWVFIINGILGLFNLIPIPPLDGSKILAGLLPKELADTYLRIHRLGFVILIGVMITGVHKVIISWGVLLFSYALPSQLGEHLRWLQPSGQ